MRTFEVGKVYLVKHRLNRYFFEVVSRTPQTITVNLRGVQEDASQFDPYKITPSAPSSQKIRVHASADAEYGWVKVQFDLWGQPATDRVEIFGNMEVIIK